MKFKVPQFLEIEDKIFGPFTFKEFVYLVGGGGLCFVIYKALGLVLGIIPMLIVAGISLALIFYRPNNKPLINMIQAGFTYFLQSKLYIWKRREVKAGKQGEKKSDDLQEKNRREILSNGNKLSGNKLRDLAWSLDVLDLNKQSSDQS